MHLFCTCLHSYANLHRCWKVAMGIILKEELSLSVFIHLSTVSRLPTALTAPIWVFLFGFACGLMHICSN